MVFFSVFGIISEYFYLLFYSSQAHNILRVYYFIDLCAHAEVKCLLCLDT